MYSNYIFDFGQVLIRFVPDEIVGDFVSDPKDVQRISPVLFDRLYWDRLDLGTITDEELKESVAARLPQEDREIVCKIYDHWFEDRPIIDGMPSLLDDLKEKGAHLYLLSNISQGFAENFHKFERLATLLSKFDGLVFSAPLHLVKPGPEIFSHLLSRYHLNPKDCLFIDDSQKNLDGAKAMGIDGYLFDGDSERLRRDLLS